MSSVPYNVITQVLRVVFQNSEPHPADKTMWAKRVGEDFIFYVFWDGEWHDVSGTISVPEVSVYLSSFINDAEFLTANNISGLQEALVSGENIKTINGESILGEGNITITSADKADKVTGATNGNFAGLDASGNLTDSGKKPSDFATTSQGAKADTAYQKPSTGIPSTDLASSVQTSLGKADTAYQKPSGGIPATDLASGVIPDISTKQDTLVSGTNIKTVNNTSLLGSGNIEIGGAVDSVNGQTGVVVLDAADVGAYELPSTGIPSTDMASAVQTSLGKADTAVQPSAIANMQVTTNKVTSWQSTPDNTHYPSEKLVYDEIGNVEDVLDAVLGSETLPTQRKMAIVSAVDTTDPTAPITTLSAAVNTYYTIPVEVGTLAITLPEVTDTTHIQNIVFMLTTGSTPAVTFAAAGTGVGVIAQDGFSIEASTTYEVNAIYNGTKWVLAAMKLSTTDIQPSNS